jgi:Skp family chaperone for outer membrane proteins
VKLAAEFRLQLEEDNSQKASEKAYWERHNAEQQAKLKEVSNAIEDFFVIFATSTVIGHGSTRCPGRKSCSS